jgi:iron complex transport system substrate-binding protein
MRFLKFALIVILCSGCRIQTAQEQRAATHTPQRIVSISPNVTEILYGVGAWPQVVAVSQYCSYPDDVKTKPRVSGWDTTNLEQLIALKPDLVIGVETQAPFLKDKLDQLDVRSLFVESQTLADVYTAMETIGKVTGHEQEATELVARTRQEIENIRRTVADRQHVTVLCVIGRLPGTIRELYTATHGSYLDELITMAGGESVAPPGERGWGKITKEAAVSLNPEVIIDVVQHTNGKLGEDPIAVWRELPEVRAVRNNRIYPIADQFVVHPSQFVAHTAQLFARAIHPEAFSNER